jgi:hypothetical protein
LIANHSTIKSLGIWSNGDGETGQGAIMTLEEGQILPPEYAPNVLVVMARGSADGLWRAAGGEVSAQELCLPADLVVRLGRWSSAFTAAVRDENDPQRSAILATFSAEGLSIARDVQRTVGNAYEILYFDEAKLEADGYLTDYLYPASLEA